MILQLAGLVASAASAWKLIGHRLASLKGILRPPIKGNLNVVLADVASQKITGLPPTVTTSDSQRIEEVHKELREQAAKVAEAIRAEHDATERRFQQMEEWVTALHFGWELRVITAGLVLLAFGTVYATISKELAEWLGCG